MQHHRILLLNENTAYLYFLVIRGINYEMLFESRGKLTLIVVTRPGGDFCDRKNGFGQIPCGMNYKCSGNALDMRKVNMRIKNRKSSK